MALESTSMASSHAAMQQGWLFRVSNKGRLNSIARRSLALESGNPTRQPIDMVLQVTVPAFWSLRVTCVELNSHDQRFMTQTPAIPTSELRPGLHALGTRCLDQGSLLTLLGFRLAADLYPLAVELGSPIESGAMHGAGDGPNISDLRATPATSFCRGPVIAFVAAFRVQASGPRRNSSRLVSAPSHPAESRGPRQSQGSLVKWGAARDQK